jgi:hypothetical protein
MAVGKLTKKNTSWSERLFIAAACNHPFIFDVQDILASSYQEARLSEETT